MMIVLIKHKIELYLMNKKLTPSIDLVQSDTGREVECSFPDYTIPSGSTAEIWAIKPSGKIVFNQVTILNNTISFKVTNQMIAEKGYVVAQIKIKNAGKMISTFEFRMRSNVDISGNGSESKNEITALDKFLEEQSKKLDDAIALKTAQITKNTEQIGILSRGKLDNAHDTSATAHADIREDLTLVKQNLNGLREEVKSYNETFFRNFFAMQRTGKVYTVRFPLWGTSQVSVGEKLDDNLGLVMEASTLTERGKDDYCNIPLFKTFDCNVESYLGRPKITAIKGDKEFDAKEKDTFVLGMAYYHKFWVEGGYFYYSRSDSPHEGYVICDEAKKTVGSRPFCLYGKYVAGRNSKGVLGSYKDKAPVRSLLSYLGCINEAKKRGKEYAFGCASEYAYIQNTFMLKYADRNWNKLLGGCFTYYEQVAVSLPESNSKRVVLSTANANKFIVGSSVSVGDLGADTNKDRGNAKIHNICDNVKIMDIVEVDAENKALVLDIPNNITTTATTWVTPMHWMSGFSDDILGTDGCPCQTKSQIPSMKYPSVIQGIELAVGGYECLGNAFMETLTDPLFRDVYVCDDSEKLTTDTTTAKKNYKKLPKQLHVEKNDQWNYGTEIHMDLENGINVITKAGAAGSGTNSGFCDGIYFDKTTNTQREFLLLGDLWGWDVGGAFCSYGCGGLGGAWWAFLARLSLSVYRGEFA